MVRSSLAEDFEKLLNVGIALSSIHDLQKLLDLILQEARRLTKADAGTLYLAKEGQLIFKVSQCQSLVERCGRGVHAVKCTNPSPCPFPGNRLPVMLP